VAAECGDADDKADLDGGPDHAAGIGHEARRDLDVARAQVEAAKQRLALLSRGPRPEEVASACVFLASDLSTGITGEDVNVSAGLVMY